MTYDEANSILGKRDSRKIGNNTYLQRRGGSAISVRLHATDVVTFYPDSFELNTGGWRTVTTKARINGYSPVRVYSEKGRWYAFPRIPDWSHKIPFIDGMRFDYNGNVLSDVPSVEDDAAAIRDANRLKRRIAKYAKLCADELAAGNVHLPSGADCWYCAMHLRSDGSLGDAIGSTEHLTSHMDESYVVPSLLWNAVAEKGYLYPAIILGANENGMGQSYFLRDSVTRAIRDYLKRRLLSNETGAKPIGAPTHAGGW